MHYISINLLFILTNYDKLYSSINLWFLSAPWEGQYNHAGQVFLHMYWKNSTCVLHYIFMTFAENLTTFYYSVFHDGILAALISFIICAICGPFFIKSLKALHIKQVFRTKEQVRELAQLHKSKARIPTMGRLIISSLVSTNIHLLFVLAKLY